MLLILGKATAAFQLPGKSMQSTFVAHCATMGRVLTSAGADRTQTTVHDDANRRMERELIVERTRAGLQAARHQGRVGGRKRQMTDSKIQAARKLLASGTPPCEVAQSLGVSVPTLYRWVPASSRT